MVEADKYRYIRCISESATNTQDILNTFDRYRGHIKILHFGGHANGKVLMLHHQKVQATGLATLLKTENEIGSIELVFLNACATIGQVRALLTAGVKSVIATTAQIKDDQASLFAQRFYRSMASGAPIKEAYQKATSLLLMEEKKHHNHLRYWGEARGIDELHHLSEEDDLPWALYTLDNQQNDFRLNVQGNQIISEDSSVIVHNQSRVNKQINHQKTDGDFYM